MKKSKMNFKRKIRYSLLRLFRSKKESHHTALGLAFGFFPCWFPTFGIGAIFSVTLAKLVKANVVAAAVSAGIGSFLWPALFYLNYLIGDLINFEKPTVHQGVPHYSQTVEQISSSREIGVNFLTGAVVNSITFAIISYLIAYFIFWKYRVRMLDKLRKKRIN